MRALRSIVAVSIVIAGCSSSHSTGDPDAAITIMLDAGPPRPDSFVPGPVCGNAIPEAGEACDDGNTDAGDGCAPDCTREPYCGDGVTTAPEVCDDENHRSDDGCRSDCGSDETCGNMIVDYATGEVCDSTDGCEGECTMLLACGDGTVGAGEECDDENTARWDGCGPDCREEISMHVDELAFGGPRDGCDYTGDGMPDNQFSRALGAAAPLLNMGLSGGGGGPDFLMSFLGLDDRTGSADDSLRLAWMLGEPGPTTGTYLVDAAALRDDGTALTSLQASIVAHHLDAGPEDIDLPFGFLPLTLYQGRIEGTTVASGGELSRLDEGLLCGVIPPTLLTIVTADQIEMFGGGSFTIEIGDPCDGSAPSPTLADMLIGGFEVLGITIGNRSPDIDLDGDGLETFEVMSDGPEGCQPVVVACIDGDGTRIEGRECMSDVAIADGYSAGLTFVGTRTEIVGTNAGPTPVPGGS
jgi:cysteine-rich repeat protein